jgi:uncharacterized protein (PEP-CTERM system associated)
MIRIDVLRHGRIGRGVSRVLALAVLSILGHAAVAQTEPPPGPEGRSMPRPGTDARQNLPSGLFFQPRVGTAVQYVSNLTLVEDGEPQVDMAGLEIAPGFNASYSSATTVGVIDYELIGRAWEDSDFNDIAQRLGANGQWDAVPEWFYLRGQASYADAVIDPRFGVNYGGLGIFGPGNLTDVATASVSPVFQRRFGDWQATVFYSYGRTWYFDEGRGEPVVGFGLDQDSIDQAAGASFGTADPDARVSARVFYDWQDSEFENSLPYRYERAGFEGGYDLGRTLTLVGDAGVESDLEASTTEGGLDSNFWSAGLRWRPSERTTAEARVGERFFGNSWMGSIEHRARMLTFSASYTEEPTVETQTLSLGEFDPGDLPPGIPGQGVGRFNSRPYVSREARATARAEGARTQLSVDVFHDERDYLDLLSQDETNAGIVLRAVRDLASNLVGEVELSYTDYERAVSTLVPNVEVTTTDRDTEAIVRFTRTTSPRLALIAETGYLMRDGEDQFGDDSDYDGFWVGLRARWTP